MTRPIASGGVLSGKHIGEFGEKPDPSGLHRFLDSDAFWHEFSHVLKQYISPPEDQVLRVKKGLGGVFFGYANRPHRP